MLLYYFLFQISFICCPSHSRCRSLSCKHWSAPDWRCCVVPLQKKSQENINSRVALVMKSGKYTLGYKTVLKTLRSGKCKLGSPAFPLDAILLTRFSPPHSQAHHLF